MPDRKPLSLAGRGVEERGSKEEGLGTGSIRWVSISGVLKN